MAGPSQSIYYLGKITQVLRRLCVVLFGLTPILLIGCPGEEQPTQPSPIHTEGFAFFDVGETTQFSDALRERLKKSLGPEAIEYRNIINLEVNSKGFLENYFPELHQLNLRLNTPLGERIEHNTIKLMYRYARNNDLPFDYIELVFSKHTGKPLYIHIYSRKDITDVFRTIGDKFGEPSKIDLPQATGQSIYWIDKKNVLLVTMTPTRQGNQLNRLMIYFSENIAELVSIEEKERREKEEGRRRAGERAF